MEENLYKEVNDALKNVFAITSRIDERMKMLVENHNEAKDKIEKLYDNQVAILNRLTVLENSNSSRAFHDLKDHFDKLESKINDMGERLFVAEKELTSTANKWGTILDFIFKVGTVVVGAIILWKLGIKP